MKRPFPFLSFFGNWLLVFCATLGTPMCVVTAYDLPYHLGAMILCALLISGFMTLMFTVPELGGYLLVPFGATVLLISIFRWKKLYSGAVVAIRTIQAVLSRTIAFIPTPGTLPAEVENYAYFIGFFMGAVMVTVALLISWGLVSGESMFLPLLVPLPLVALSLIYTDLPPAGWAGVLVALYYGGVLVTGGLRLHRGNGIGRVTLLSLLVLLLAVLALVRLLPPEEYEPRSTQERVEELLRQLASTWEKMDRLFERDIHEREDLSREGEQESTGAHILDVKADQSGRLYLRGTSYGRYDGHFWSMTGEYPAGEALYTLGGSLPGAAGRVEIRDAGSSLLYTPYALVKEGDYGDVRENYISHEDRPQAYSWAYRAVPATLTPRLGNEAEQAYAAWAKRTYTRLTSAQRQALLDFLNPYELPDTDDPYALARAVAAIVQGNVTYDLVPGATPTEEDFALYFLTVSKRGYCVHYASAVTALLQAKGVPARFVIGYALTVADRDTWVEVTDRYAHAWTEVYVNGWGWVPIEATGGDDPGLDEPAPTADPGDDPDLSTPTPPPEDTPEPTPEEPTPEPSTEPSAEPSPDSPEASATPTPTPTPPEPSAGLNTPTPDPEQQGDEDDPPGGGLRLWWLWLLLLLPLLAVLYVLLRKRVLETRMRRMLQGDGREAVLRGFGELNRLVRWGASAPEDARILAEEAAFSHHDMGEKQKRAMAGFVKAARRELEQALPWYRLWLLRYVLWLW